MFCGGTSVLQFFDNDGNQPFFTGPNSPQKCLNANANNSILRKFIN